MVPLFAHGRKSLHFTLINFEATVKMSVLHGTYTEEIEIFEYICYPFIQRFSLKSSTRRKKNFNLFSDLAYYFKYMLVQR